MRVVRQRLAVADAFFDDPVGPLAGAFDQAATGKGLGDAAIAGELLVENVVGRDARRKAAGADDLNATGKLADKTPIRDGGSRGG